MRVLALILLAACTDKAADDSTPPADDSAPDDTGVDPAWNECPGADAYVGDASWTGLAEATNAAVYCALPNEERDLAGELAAKGKLRVVSGSYPLPAAEGSYTLSFPVCTLRADPAQRAEMSGDGTTEVSITNFAGSSYTYLDGQQPMTVGGASHWLAHALILAGDEGSAPDPLRMDGTGPDLSTGATTNFYLFADGGNPFESEAQTFGACDDPAWVRNVHEIVFDGGALTLAVHIGTDNIITAPSQLLSATGTLDGVAFDIADYFRLIYRPGHHHYSRDFAVLLDEPVGEACAILVREVDDQPGTTTAIVHTADCALNPLQERAVTSESWTEG